ncbi:MAG: hypothetical protein ACI8WB_003954 [Phenylobacterium sp.]|jgi:hypothetical protein
MAGLFLVLQQAFGILREIQVIIDYSVCYLRPDDLQAEYCW